MDDAARRSGPAGHDLPGPAAAGSHAAAPHGPGVFAGLAAGLLLTAAATELLGLHVIFGAFLFGAICPRGREELRTEVVDRLTSVGRQLLLPVFFVLAGFQLDLTGIGLPGLGELAAILAVAVIGKTGGTYLAATLHGLPQEEAATLAVLMNTRGLTEIVVLSIGLQVGILDHRLYSLLVIMALATTAMTGPLLSLIRRSTRRQNADRTAVAPQPCPASAHGPGCPNRLAGGHALARNLRRHGGDQVPHDRASQGPSGNRAGTTGVTHPRTPCSTAAASKWMI